MKQKARDERAVSCGSLRPTHKMRGVENDHRRSEYKQGEAG